MELLGNMSSDEDATMPHLSPEPEETDDEGQFAFRRNKMCSYHMVSILLHLRTSTVTTVTIN